MFAISRCAQWFALAVVTALLGAAAHAHAELPAELKGLPVVSVQLGGEAAALTSPDALGIPRGARLERELVRSALRRLIDSGRFADVQIDAVAVEGGAALKVWLTPRVTLQRVEMSGNAHLEDAAIRDALHLGPGSEVAASQLQEFAGQVAKLYADHGYFAARVETALRPTRDPAVKILVVAIHEGTPTTIRSLVFSGQPPRDPAAVLANVDLARGDVLDRGKLQEAIANAELFLRGHGFLEADLGTPRLDFVGAEADVAIPSHLGPKYELRVSGYTGFSRSEIVNALGLEREGLNAELQSQTLKARLQEFYARRGFAEARVELRREPGKTADSAYLRISIERGPQRWVAAISFAGARHFSRDFLKEQLLSYLNEELPGSSLTAQVDSEVADTIWTGQSPRQRRSVPIPPITNPERLYYEPVYKKAMEHITELYRSDGFLSARVGPVQLERIGKDRSAVLIPVVEGPRTLVHQVSIRGNEALTEREVLIAAHLNKDQPFSHLLLEQARRSIVEAYQERGYMFATAEAVVHFSSDRTRAEIELQVVERYPVHIRQVLIQGAERTDEALIRRVIRLQPGDLFRPSVARESERELGRLQVFSGVSVTLKEPELASRVKTVLVTVSERLNQFVGFSAGVSTGQGVRAGFEYGYRNLFGQAFGLGLRTQFAYQPFFYENEIQERFDKLPLKDRLERHIAIGTTIPRIPGLGRVRTALDLVHLRSNERDFGITQFATSLTFTHATTDELTLTLGGDLENNDVQLFPDPRRSFLDDPRLRRLLRVSEGKLVQASGHATLVAARASLSYDLRDSAFTPTQGFFISTAIEGARTLSSEQQPDQVDEFFSRFLKLSVTASGYVPLGNDVVIAAQARAGRIFHLHDASKTYPTRAFFLGGVDSLRGYVEDELVPQDVSEVENLDPDSIVRSGDAFVLYRIELRFPLYREFRGGLFTDLGNLWADASNLDPLNVRPTAGIGLRLDTPVGPLALDWGFNLNPRRALNERATALHFAIGLF